MFYNFCSIHSQVKIMPHNRNGETQKATLSQFHAALSRLRHYDNYADIGINVTVQAISTGPADMRNCLITSSILLIIIIAKRNWLRKWEQLTCVT